MGSVIKHHVFQVLWVPVSGGKAQNGFEQRREDPFSASLLPPTPTPCLSESPPQSMDLSKQAGAYGSPGHKLFQTHLVNTGP